ncbi:hypothetical protein P43SY_005298 [Pythium insidiosum]|uniref:ABC transporter domain-containing protein n=1 Tax=Pythium insidiosum TaxID=114742 RepID=A0AAD5LXX8_PYTIN|nr:hypothetical protein P43SY_005298 [Pythium insidiosum]
MGRLLSELGYHYKRGEKRHIHAESDGNVRFRDEYIAKKLANRAEVQGSHGKVVGGISRPEVYLDESFCNVNHVTGKTWLTSDKIRGERVGVVGRTGSGKSSLAMALFRMHPLVSGRILVDGVDISRLSLKTILGFDRILVMANGSVVEQGSATSLASDPSSLFYDFLETSLLSI